MNETTNEIRGGDPLKAVIARWTLDRLHKDADLAERLRRAEHAVAWQALSKRAAREVPAKGPGCSPRHTK
jgi:hypothetical protein